MAARLTRARKSLAHEEFAVPTGVELGDRVAVVADVAYLAFTAGYAPGSGPDLLRADVSAEAIRLVRVLRDVVPRCPRAGRAPRTDAPPALAPGRAAAGRKPRAAPRPGPDRWHQDEIVQAPAILEPLVDEPPAPFLLQALSPRSTRSRRAAGDGVAPDRVALRRAAHADAPPSSDSTARSPWPSRTGRSRAWPRSPGAARPVTGTTPCGRAARAGRAGRGGWRRSTTRSRRAATRPSGPTSRGGRRRSASGAAGRTEICVPSGVGVARLSRSRTSRCRRTRSPTGAVARRRRDPRLDAGVAAVEAVEHLLQVGAGGADLGLAAGEVPGWSGRGREQWAGQRPGDSARRTERTPRFDGHRGASWSGTRVERS